MKSINSLFLFIFVLESITVYSQTSKISGTITTSDGEVVPFANLTLPELSFSTLSNYKGQYYFSTIPKGSYHINISHTGYLNKTISINNTAKDSTLDITLIKSLIETPTIDVTGSFSPIDISNSTFSVTSISPRTLTRIRNENIASTIQNIPGVNNISTGTAIGKPVIRGMSSQSVIIIQDGVKHESQQWGDEHAPEISLFDLDRIEILRGPASLIYGADGIGGVVNIISKPLQFSSKDDPISYGVLDLNAFSMNSEGAADLMLGVGTKTFGIKGSLGYRKGGNIKTPKGQLTVNTPEGENIIEGGELFNSGSKEFEAGTILGYKGEFGNINAEYHNFNRELQLHENPAEDPTATPNQKIVTNTIEGKGNIYLSNNLQLEPMLSYETQSRIEYESAEDKENNLTALNLSLKLFQADVKLNHNVTHEINGAVGFSFISQDNKTLGVEKLIPNYQSTDFGFYVMEKLEKKYFTVSLGGRFDTESQNIKETVFEVDEKGNPTKVVLSNDLTFNSFSGSFGAVYKPIEKLDIFTNIGSGWRPPSEFDLYSDGVHEGTGRFDRGLIILDPDSRPDPERSINLDLGTRIRTKYFNAEISFFRNRINNFIYPSPTGETDSASGLPVYDITQAKSTFIGYEYNLQFQFVDWMLLSFKGDFVETKNNETLTPLPFSPPAKNIIEVKFQKESFGSLYNPYINFSTKIVSPQNNVDPLEEASAGYTLFSAGLGFDFVLSKSITSIDFSVSNLGNVKYADHLSRYRYYAMGPERSYNLKISVPFRF